MQIPYNNFNRKSQNIRSYLRYCAVDANTLVRCIRKIGANIVLQDRIIFVTQMSVPHKIIKRIDGIYFLFICLDSLS